MEFSSKYHEVANLHVQSAALTWQDGPQPHATIDNLLKNLENFDIPKGQLLELFPIYNGGEEFSGVYRIGQKVDTPQSIFWSVAGHIALTALDETGLLVSYQQSTPALHQFLSQYGTDAADLLCDLAFAACSSASTQYRRCQAALEDKPLFAPLGTDDPRFDEASFVQCEATDDCATLVTWMPFDADAYTDLFDLLEQKRGAALIATRAPVEPA